MNYSVESRYRAGVTIMIAIMLVLDILVACGPSHSAQQTGAKGGNASVKRYQLTGRVVSIDKPAQSVNIDGDVERSYGFFPPPLEICVSAAHRPRRS